MAVQPIGDLLDLPMRAAERRAAGQALRRLVPRSAHATFVPSPGRRDPVQVLIEADAGRMPGLLPIRYDRMRRSPFAFMRGAMAIMAADLAATPTSGIRVQSVGNCHAANFGIRAMPDGTMTFDINDFDETLPAPFEWDVKRLAGSTAIAAMGRQLPARLQRQIARATVRSYRLEMMALASLDPVIAWHHRTDVDAALEEIGDRRLRERTAQRWAVITAEDHAGYPHLLERHKGLPRLREHPPLLIRFTAGTSDAHEAATRAAFASYRRTLEEERRVLLDRYHLIDVALKVAGVAGVGTFCAIGLFLSPDNAPLLLQIREAQRSLLSPYAGTSEYGNQGQRVVVGQRIMQAADDIFTGWTRDPGDDRHCYVRRLRDGSLAMQDDHVADGLLRPYAELCGRALARAHARSGTAAMIAGYLGKSTSFDNAVAEFAVSYARQTARDYRAFVEAVAAEVIEARSP